MSATIGGTGKNFNVIPPVAQTLTVAGVTTINITGVLNASTGESMILQLTNSNGGGPLVAGKYTDSSSLYDVEATYALNVGSQFEAGSAVWSVASAASLTINHFVLNITSINSTAIQGTFSGDIFPDGDPTAAAKAVTNGTFNAKFQ
jgi:hypothetical protein